MIKHILSGPLMGGTCLVSKVKVRTNLDLYSDESLKGK